MKTIAILTTFFEATSGYSLIAVTETQIRLLIKHGYEPRVLVQDDFSFSEYWRPEMMDVRPVVPSLESTPEEIFPVLKEQLDDVDVCIAHDIIFQPSYQAHDKALRQYASERDDLLWLHWIHSRPGGQHQPPPGYIIYPNDIDKNQVAKSYQLDMNRVKACRAGHAIDPLLTWPYDKLTHDLLRKFDLTGGEINCIYPVRLDRGKQVEKIIRLLAGIQKTGYEPRLLIVAWQSSGERFQVYIDELLELSDELGLKDKIAFTNRLDDRCDQGVPRHVVTELMDLSNVYIHASSVETYSLVVHEAILRGKLVVLNHDWPPMRELFGEAGIYMDFGSELISRNGTQEFWNEEAHRLTNEYQQNRALVAQTKARREWQPSAMWRDFETLLYLEPC
jgi:hypothetical protein